jgi:hypothetical protein
LVAVGLSPDEAARLIQQVHRKVRRTIAQKRSIDCEDSVLSSKTWEETMIEMSQLMQIVHLNNVDLHKSLRKNKDSIEVDDIKSINIPDLPKNLKVPTADDQTRRTSTGGLTSTPKSHVNGNTRHFETARKKTSVPIFYTDNGPRDNWDTPLTKHVKITGLKRLRIGSKATAISNKMESFTPAQSLLAENESMNLLSQVSIYSQHGLGRNKKPGLIICERLKKFRGKIRQIWLKLVR